MLIGAKPFKYESQANMQNFSSPGLNGTKVKKNLNRLLHASYPLVDMGQPSEPTEWRPPMPAITIYTTTYCPYCVKAKDLLKRKGATWTEISAEDDAVREAMIVKAGGRRTVPQIFIGETHVGGCDDLYALDKAGKLDALLAG
jgi:glutaredoxin 3